MKERVSVAVVQMQVAWFDPRANLERMRQTMECVAQRGDIDLVVFPELANSGYVKGRDKDFARDYVKLAEPVPGPFSQALEQLARRHRTHVVAGLLEAHPTITGTVYNSAVLIAPESGLLGVHRKMHIPGEERHYFYPGNTADVFSTELGNLGIVICADQRFPELSRVLALKGAEILCCPANIPGAERTRLDPERAYVVPRCRAMENRVFFIECNRVGTQEDLVFQGRSSVAGPLGELLARSDSEDEDTLYTSLCADALYEARGTWPDFRDRRPEHYGLLAAPL
jgi:predicted amidohydrolase